MDGNGSGRAAIRAVDPRCAQAGTGIRDLRARITFECLAALPDGLLAHALRK